MKNFLVIILSLVFCFGLAACENNNEDGTSGNGNQQSIAENILYIDENTYSNGDLSLEYRASAYGFGTDANYSLSLYIDVKSSKVDGDTVTIKGQKLIRESNGAIYTLNDFNNSLTLECDVKKTVSFHATIPTSLEAEHYKITLKVNNTPLELRLYKMPRELKMDVKLSYSLDGQIIHEETFKKDDEVLVSYVWEDLANRVYYCNEWHKTNTSQPSYVSPIRKFTITEDTTLFGFKSNAIKYLTTSSDTYSFVNDINYVYSDHIVVIPKKYLDKDICISNFVFKNETIYELYLPTSLKRIYSGNFANCGLRKIHFAGTKEQWDAIESSSTIPAGVEIVYNSSYPMQ